MVIAAELTGLIQTMATVNNLVAAQLYNLLLLVLPLLLDMPHNNVFVLIFDPQQKTGNKKITLFI
jgi:hypothetical protein